MKRQAFLIAAIALLAAGASAASYSNTYYGQEGTAKDGYGPINAAGKGPAGDVTDNYTNWKWQSGSGSWTAVYSWDSDAWLTMEETGDSAIDVECDIELYWQATIEKNKIYFHLGNPFTATEADKTAIVNGTYQANHLQWIGISFANTSKVNANNQPVDPNMFDLATGIIRNGMVGTKNLAGGSIANEKFDIKFLARCNNGPWDTPDQFDYGAHNSIPATLWWSPIDLGMTLGSGTYDFLVQILPTPDQADGNYNLDPEVVFAPVL